MPCNSCAQPFTIFRKEKGCPSCGFSFCSKCLDNKVFVKKVNKEAKVCTKCKNAANQPTTTKIEPPDAYFKRLGIVDANGIPSSTHNQSSSKSDQDKEIQERLEKLKEGKVAAPPPVEDISERLRKLKDHPSTSDVELQERLARLKGIPNISNTTSKSILLTADKRTEQEQADDLLKQYLDQAQIDNVYEDSFNSAITNIEGRLQKLKGALGNEFKSNASEIHEQTEDELVKNIVKKYTAEAALEIDESEANAKELPFCEICNEDATVRCLGCRYIFCSRCFHDHKDDDDGCDRYEPYAAPKP